jgi:hypothetical protein
MNNFDRFDLKLKRSEVKKTNTDDVIGLLHTYLTPFTAKKNLKSLLPPNESPDLKEITSRKNQFSERIQVSFTSYSLQM